MKNGGTRRWHNIKLFEGVTFQRNGRVVLFLLSDTKNNNKRTNLAYTLVTDHIFFQVSCWSHEPITFPFGSYLKSRRHTETETNSVKFHQVDQSWVNGSRAVGQACFPATGDNPRCLFFSFSQAHTNLWPTSVSAWRQRSLLLSNPSSTSPRRDSAREVCQLWRKTAGSCRLNRANRFGVERKN